MSLISKVCLLTPPAWTLNDLVAVNPFLGYADKDITDAHCLVGDRLGAELLPQLSFYKDLYAAKRINDDEIRAAFEEIRVLKSEKINQLSLTPEAILQTLSTNCVDEVAAESGFRTLAELLDTRLARSGYWRTAILIDISRFCSARFDTGISLWKSKQSQDGLFKDWKRYTLSSHAMRARGLKKFKQIVQSLPEEPLSAITFMLELFGCTVNSERYFAALLGDVPGWAGFLRQRAWQIGHSEIGELPDLLALRMAYDLSLLLDLDLRPTLVSSLSCLGESGLPSEKEQELAIIKFILLRANELRVKKEILSELSPTKEEQRIAPMCQAVFCIDVRSEILRRQTENLNCNVETYGFAGFFGLPVSIERSDGRTQAQCPVLLEPAVTLASASKFRSRFLEKLILSFSKSAVSCFTFVETLGFGSALTMIKSMFGLSPRLREEHGEFSFSPLKLEEKVSFALGILKNLSIKAPYGRFIFLCGHESLPTNNPQAAALGCGACGGHSGRVNAALGAELLNDSLVRAELAKLGWEIPKTTLVISGVHETITDKISILSPVPDRYQKELLILKECFDSAQRLTNLERSLRLFDTLTEANTSFLKLMNDISETRPEWGLAGNAAFIAAPRSTIRTANLKGRAFLHNYEAALDTDDSVLETILTAPVVVASWINLQYFASTVDKDKFGSGNKTIHNILGGIGVVCGNDGDLAVGLSAQSVHDGNKNQHEPVRLQVFIEAAAERISKIIYKHKMLEDLVRNDWIVIYSLSSTEGKLVVERIC